jgi:hypothetical protein
MNILINLIIFVIVLFIYLHVSFQLKINNDLEVLEIDEEILLIQNLKLNNIYLYL